MNQYRIDQIKLTPDEEQAVQQKNGEEIFASKIRRILEKAGISDRGANEIEKIQILRRSIDGRGGEVHFVYALAFDSRRTIPAGKMKRAGIREYREADAYRWPEPGNERLAGRPVVVGFGPCGMFCALVLAEAGYRPLVIERGEDVETRTRKVERFWQDGVLDPECNVQFGEGGAGTFSDGKLNTGVKDPRIRFVLETFVQAGADADILIDARPHIGTDRLRVVVKNIRERIEQLGGEIRFGTRLDELEVEAGKITGIRVSRAAAGMKTGGREEDGQKAAKDADPSVDPSIEAGRISASIPCQALVLALGHSARDTVRTLYAQGIAMEPKPFSMGVRVQHPQEVIDRANYGQAYGHPSLPPAYYKLAYRAADGRGVYSFCMCPGGEIVCASSQEGGVVTNGMSNRRRDSGQANSGILVDVRTSDFPDAADPLSGIALQEEYERRAYRNAGGRYKPPETTYGQLQAGEAPQVAASLPDFVLHDLLEAMPEFGRKIKGFDAPETVIKAIESRSSSPVRILRDRETLQAEPGFYPAGEGAGYAGGITSAACDGIKIAEQIIQGFARPDEAN